MSVSDLTRTIERHNQQMARLPAVRDKADRTVRRAERVMDRIDAHDGVAREARRREYERVMGGFGKRLLQVGIAVGVVSLATIVIGLMLPGGIGMFGFLAAIGIAIAVAAVAMFWPRQEMVIQKLDPAVSNAQVVSRFDSFLTRHRPALPPPAQVEVDSIHALMTDFSRVIAKIDKAEPEAQETRRLMTHHLPGLIERYAQVPPSYRDSVDGEGLTVDERLADGLKAGRKAIEEIGEKLARKDLAALETHGRFMKSRYGEEEDAIE